MSHYRYGRTVGEFVRRYRNDVGISQSKLGHMLGCTGQFVSNTERGVHDYNVGFAKRFVRICPEERRGFFIDLVCDSVADRISSELAHEALSNRKRRKK